MLSLGRSSLPMPMTYPRKLLVSLCRTLGCSLTCRCRRRSSLQRVLTGVGLQRAVVAATTGACGCREQDPVAGCEEDGRIPDPRRYDGERFEEWLTGRRYFDWSTQARRRCEYLARALGSLSRLAVDTPGWSTFTSLLSMSLHRADKYRGSGLGRTERPPLVGRAPWDAPMTRKSLTYYV